MFFVPFVVLESAKSRGNSFEVRIARTRRQRGGHSTTGSQRPTAIDSTSDGAYRRSVVMSPFVERLSDVSW